MIKIIGALMIVCGTTFWGIGSVMRMKNRVAALQSLIVSADIMRDEICVNLTPLMRVMEIAGQASPEPAAQFYKSVAAKEN